MQRLGEEALRQRPPLFGIAGYKNAGKTTLIVDLVRDLVARGWRVGTIKHAHHDFDIDHPGKDSHRHRSAGAAEVIVASARRVAHIRELGSEREPTLDELSARMVDVDLVLVEGWKSGGQPRLELRRDAAPAPAIAGNSPGVVAIVSDTPIAGEALPVLIRDNVAGIADFVLAAVGLPPVPARDGRG
ncbi:MAG: molybdopterin-guanine dinucleotide biosynthesis protein B [Gammaproteobacteria bacterium]